ncbi:hypothetical protein GCM10011588_52780 [Nocardia jinanensis]|uniref:Uncharacterized protein n=1 Tax=Nocardia jinanensis TaxID=382504 RepID=A0A917VW33_9NOCA|nr:hypothetical protein GCM10011588_52780 [Nocardia jinanensis]
MSPPVVSGAEFLQHDADLAGLSRAETRGKGGESFPAVASRIRHRGCAGTDSENRAATAQSTGDSADRGERHADGHILGAPGAIDLIVKFLTEAIRVADM